MSNERNYYVLCEDNCRFPSMTSEQILAAIAEATGNTPTSVDNAFITKIKEYNKNGNLSFWMGSTAEYNALANAGQVVDNRLYIITDETFGEDVDTVISTLNTSVQGLTNIVQGLTNETVWISFKDSNNNTVGSFKQIGKTAFFNIKYKVYADGTGGNKVFDLPIVLDVEDEYINIPCIYYDGVTSHTKTVTYAQIFNQTVDNVTTTSLTVEKPNVSSGEYEYLHGSFCLPIQEGIIID